MLILALVATLQAGTPPSDLDPPRPISQWIHTRWTSREGAPREILALAQSADGYLWLSSWGRGLFRFDGVRFVSIPLKIGDTLAIRGVERILPATDGSLWLVLAEGRVGHLKNGYLTGWGEPEGMARVFDLALSSSGTVVAGTARGLSRFADGQWREMTSEWAFPGEQSRAVWFDSRDGLWASTEGRVVYLPPGGSAFTDVGVTYKNPNGPSPRFAQGHDGTIWVGEQARSVHTVPMLDGARPMTEVHVGSKSVVVDRKGTLWIGTVGDGLRRLLDPPRLLGRQIGQFDTLAEPFTEKDGLLSDVVNAMLEDREGNIWVGGDRGLERFREPPFVPIGSQASRRARILFTTSDTSLWVAPFATDLQRLRAGQRQPGVQATFHPTLLAQSRDGRLWTTNSRYLYRLEGGPPFTAVRIPSKEMGVSAIGGDRAGNLWVFDEKSGLLRLTGDSLTLVQPLTDSVYPHGSLFSDSKGGIWISFFRRLVRYQDGQLTTFPLGGPGTFGSEVWSLFEDSAGTTWVGGQFGIGRLEGDRFRSLTRLPGGIVLGGLTIDQEGAWWYATREGIVRLPPGEVDRAMADSSYVIQYRRFSQSDGLPGEINGMLYGPVVTRTADGTIWVATDSGVASVNPQSLPPAAVAPARIETIRVDDHELTPDSGLTIPPTPGNLEIDYTAMTLSAAEGVQFRYQLVGEDKAWREAGTRRRAYYTGLGPGSYIFHVMAGTADGAWSKTSATTRFRVLPAWYQTLWLKAGVVLLIGGCVAAATALIQRDRYRRSQLALRKEHEATLAERARIAQDLHDTLLQGFAGVSMQLKAAERALPDAPDVAAEMLIRVQQLTRETLREARERVLDLHEPDLGNADVASVLEASARGLVATTNLNFTLTIVGDRGRLRREVELAAIRIGREAIANAVRHAQARRIEVVVTFEPECLSLELRDDGCGFTAELGERAREQGHLGLSGMRNRAARAGGTCEVRPGTDGGTVVAVTLPLTYATSTG